MHPALLCSTWILSCSATSLGEVLVEAWALVLFAVKL